MSDRNDRPEADLLDRATAALRDARIPDGPPLTLVASTTEALRRLDPPPDLVRFRERRKRMFRNLRYGGAAAAALLAVLLGSLWLIDRGAAFTFAQVVENVKKAKSVRFVVKQQLGGQPEVDANMFIQGDVLRYEVPGQLALVLDTNRRKALQLDLQRKVATRMDLEGRVPQEDLKDPIERLRNLKEDVKDNVVPLADEEADGHNCHVYEVKGVRPATALLAGGPFKLWVDARTGLPVRIHAEDEKTSVTFEQFRWNEPLEEELFSLEVPKGYRLEELTPAVVKPGRLYYHQGWVELHSVQPDGKNPDVQFVPRKVDSPDVYVPEKTEMSPDGRYLAIGYTHSTNKGGFPPDRVLLWDRTRPKEEAVEVYARPDGELQSWRFSADGRRLYVSWWEGPPEGKVSEERTGTDVVDLQTKTKQPLKLPKYKDADGREKEMRFEAASADGQTYLVSGRGLHVATAEGKLLRRLTPSDVVFAGYNRVRLSPDGKRAVYVTFDPDDKSQQLFVVPLAGGEPRALVAAGKVTDVRARWSPDGKRIAYTSRQLDPTHPPFNFGRETYLKIVDADGSNAVTVLAEKVHPNGASLELTAWR